MKNTQIIFWFLLSLSLGTQSLAQDDYRQTLQSTLDSILQPYEVATGAVFGPGLAFSFNKPYCGTMRSKGSLYSGQINSIPYNLGDSVSLIKVGILGRAFAYGRFESLKELAIISEQKINELVELNDSIDFWNHFEKIKEVKAKDFAQYWVVLNCNEEDDYSDHEKNERVFMNFGTTSLKVQLRRLNQQILLEVEFNSSFGKKLRGLGCADSNESFVEFTFKNETKVKKYNIEEETCQTLIVDISEDLKAFENAITEIKFSMSKGEKRLLIDNELSQNHINLKLDCIIN
jgi:hypothetical protein